jgi:hypothetical protein
VDRVLQNTPATISETWYQGDTITDPGSVTVTVKNDAGTTVASGSASGTGAAPRTFALTAGNTATLDTLTVTWVSASAGTLTTTVEVVGGFLFTLNDLRALAGATPSNDTLSRTRTRIEQAIERRVGFSSVPRYSRKSFGGRPAWPLRLKPYIRTVRAVSTAGTDLAPADVATLPFDENGFLHNGYAGYAYSYWVDGEWRVSPYGPIVVRYEHGLDVPTEELSAAALDWARFTLTQDQSVDSRAERLITDDGTLIFGSGMTGLPSVDRVLDSYRFPGVA